MLYHNLFYSTRDMCPCHAGVRLCNLHTPEAVNVGNL